MRRERDVSANIARRERDQIKFERDMSAIKCLRYSSIFPEFVMTACVWQTRPDTNCLLEKPKMENYFATRIQRIKADCNRVWRTLQNLINILIVHHRTVFELFV